MSKQKRWTMRDLRQCLRALGCYLDRYGGKHEIWKTADGTAIPPFPKSARDNEIVHVKNQRAFFEARGIDLDLVQY